MPYMYLLYFVNQILNFIKYYNIKIYKMTFMITILLFIIFKLEMHKNKKLNYYLNQHKPKE